MQCGGKEIALDEKNVENNRYSSEEVFCSNISHSFWYVNTQYNLHQNGMV